MTENEAPDSQLPMLATPQAERLRALVAECVRARYGAEEGLVLLGDAVERDGHLFPLANLALRCREAPEGDWPALVDAHFAALADASRGGEDAEELLAGTCLRLVPTDAVGPAAPTYTREVAEGLRLALALEGPDSVRLLTDEDVARAGADELWGAARRALTRAPMRHEEVRLDGHPVLYSVYGDAHAVATKAVVLPEVVAEVTGRRMPEAGALVAVPTRHLLAFHPIVDGSAADALGDLATYAVRAHGEGPGPLSPRVYWWHEERLTSLGTGEDVPRELLDVIRALSALDRAGRLAPGTPGVGPEDPFAAALARALAHAESDPEAARVETWDAWIAAQQRGTALFAHGKDGEPPADDGELAESGDAARAWLDAFYLTLVTRDRERTTRLCQVPLDTLRGSAPVDDYVPHWIDVLQSHWLRRPVDDVVDRLVTTIKASHPDVATLAPKDFLNLVDYQPVALFHRLLTHDHEAFGEALAESLVQHAGYWGESGAPRARVALGPLALACLAYDMDFPVRTDLPYLPRYLLNRQRLEVAPG
ncbi:immunity 49 family protein [Streptomyces endophyticus]|uniref:Immunity 49 family protein n=1 Tax=Streptomyces endophyticus TaxID=714166 RepID=A0ABU6FAK4_9ACTN|nr:immunity 49 family protein [Streptomyces endophyticus]MEB8339886.1 immunity 49 family protein [Streptomyces endophyticus]